MSPEPPSREPNVVVVSIQGRTSLPPEEVARLEALTDVTFVARGPAGAMSTAEALDLFRHADVVACTPKVAPRFDARLLAGLPRLRGLALYATGYDFLDTRLLADHGVALSVLPEYSTQSVAEHTIGLFLAVSRRIHLSNDRARGRVATDVSLRGFELAGRTLGIIGCGRIGSRVAALAQAFGMTVIAYDIDPKPTPGVAFVDLDTLLRRSDVVSMHRPMRYGEPPMIGGPELARMQSGSVLVNTCRSGLVDGGAVVASIRRGHLRSYAVDDDVFAGDDVVDLLHEGRIVQSGHSAWWSDEVLDRGGRMWGEHIRALALGAPLDVVTPEPVVVDLVAGEALSDAPGAVAR